MIADVAQALHDDPLAVERRPTASLGHVFGVAEEFAQRDTARRARRLDPPVDAAGVQRLAGDAGARR